MNKQAGVSTIEVILLLVIAGLVGFTGWYIYDANHTAQTTYNKLATTSVTPVKTTNKTITDGDNAKTVIIKAGQKFDVQLASTYWQFDPLTSDTTVKSIGSPTVLSKPHALAGTGEGSITGHFEAVASGQATITAHRTSCGEALGCTGASGSYSVTIQVN